MPAISLQSDTEWTPQLDLLECDGEARNFVVETESDGTVQLRFGDGDNGFPPPAGTQFTATYRVGNGTPGNIGRKNLVHIATQVAGIAAVTNLLPATREVPRRLQHPRKQTVGVRIPRHAVTQALLAELGEPLVSSTLLLPGQDEPMTQGWEIAEQLEHAVDAVIDSGDCGTEPTTVIDFSQPEPEIVRRGAGDTSPFE